MCHFIWWSFKQNLIVHVCQRISLGLNLVVSSFTEKGYGHGF